MQSLSQAAMTVLFEAARDGHPAAAQLLADLGGQPNPSEDLAVPRVILEARSHPIDWWD